MAFGKQFHCTYLSSADIEYTLEIYVKDYSSGSTEIELGAGGCIISYDTSGENKFSPIISSKMQIPFLVETVAMKNFIASLRDTYQEQEVYAHLYTDATEPIWSGYIIMDLGSEEDVSYPYEVVLTAIDGLGLLKDHDFVQDGSTIPYSKSETFLGYSTTSSYKTIVDWLVLILAKTGMSLTTEGAATNYRISTCVDWYNEEHEDVTLGYDPLDLTKCNMKSFYTVNDNEEYSPDSFYKVLESICKAWGMRCVYWHHTFYFIQISLYKTNETGTAGTPVNLPTREYYYTGGLRATRNYVGSKYYARYELSLENTTAGDGTGLQKLAGTKYDYYPIIKQVEAEYWSALDVNYFDGFPLLDTSLGGTGSIPANTVYIDYKSLGIFDNPADIPGWYCQIPLTFYNPSSGPSSMRLNWTIKAFQHTGGGSSLQLTNSTGALTWVPEVLPTTILDVDDDVITGGVNSIFPGISERLIFDSGLYQDSIIPTHASFTGDTWEFQLQIRTVSGPDTGGGNTTSCAGHGARGLAWLAYNSTLLPNGHIYSNPTNILLDPPFEGLFVPIIATSQVGAQSISTYIDTGTTDSFEIDLGKIFWGDSLVVDSPSTLLIYDGANWVPTPVTGEWGIGTLAGTLSFTELLCQETLYNQSQISMRLNGTTALSETNKKTSGTYIKYINPIGRIEDLDNRFYAMLRAQFVTGTDEWNGDWFEISYNSLVYTETTQDNPGENTGGIVGGGNSGGPPVPMPGAMFNQSYIPTNTSTRVTAGTITSIPIIDIGSTLLATDDVIEIFDFIEGATYQFVLSANQSSGDTSLSVDSQAITADITKGSIITISSNNLIVQYQRKTEGTIAGMPVTTDTLGPITFAGGAYSILGSDATSGEPFIKILPSDFMVNDDAASLENVSPAVFNDGTNTGVSVENSAQELIAIVNIPTGLAATEVYIWGYNTTKTVEVYEMDIDANGKGSTIGTGTTNGSAISIGTIAATITNYLMIKVLVSSINHRIWGGKVTITQP